MPPIAMKLLKRAYDAHQLGSSLVTTSDMDILNPNDLELALEFLHLKSYIRIEKRYVHGASYSITDVGIDYMEV